MSLEAARVNAKLTIEQACDKLGITKQTLINYEKNRTSPTIEMVLKMCDLYGCHINQLNFLP
jgi:DNA-binding XRE family transcriptional regulator